MGVHRALGGEGLSAGSGDILLESLVACAGVTLGQIAKAMEADSDIMLPVKYLEIVGDKLGAAGWSWGYCSAVIRKRTQGALIVRLLSKIPRVSRSHSCAHSGRFSSRGIMKQNCITSN